MSPADTNSVHATVLRHFRVSAAVAGAWWGRSSGMPNRHEVRTARLRKVWPELAGALDALVESLPGEVEEAQFLNGIGGSNVACPVCGQPASELKGVPDPRTAQQVHRVQPCGHTVDKDTAIMLWESGLNVDVTPVDGAALIRAEVHRNRGEMGRTAEHDASLDAGQLAWAAWCYLDRRDHPEADDEPAMWPEGMEWKSQPTALRSLIVAGSLIASEIDRLLAEGAPVRRETVTAGAAHDAPHGSDRV